MPYTLFRIEPVLDREIDLAVYRAESPLKEYACGRGVGPGRDVALSQREAIGSRQFPSIEDERMPRSRELTRRRILDAAYLLFRARGYARVSVEEIAAAATVTKRTLYRHFESKDVIVGEIFEAQHRLALTTSRTFSHVPVTADELVDGLFSEIATWSATSRWSGSGFTRLVVELADFPGHPARAIARKHKAMLEVHVAAQLKRLNVASPVERARQIWLLAEGAMLSMLIHRDPTYVEIAAGAAKELLQLQRGTKARKRNRKRATRLRGHR